jgi:ankyrin repeat protein
MLVAVEGSVAIGELLISKGANINQVTPHGTSAVSLAVIRGHVRFLKFLLENGADANAILNGVPIEKWIPSCLFGPKKEAAMLALLDEYRVRISN